MSIGFKIFVSIVLGALLLWTGTVGYQEHVQLKKVQVIEQALAQKLPNLAWEFLQEFRAKAKVSRNICQYLTITSRLLGDEEDILLEAQRCIFSGHTDTSYPYLNLSVYHERKKDLNKAKKVLALNLNNVKANLVMFRRLASLYIADKDIDMAANVFSVAAKSHTQNIEIQAEAINFLASQGKWKLAGEIIPYLENTPNLNIQIKLLMARVVQNLGNKAKSTSYMDNINRSFKQLDPKTQAALKRNFVDVFGYK